MALLLLLALAVIASMIMLLAPVARLREETPGENLLTATAIQLLPLVLAATFLFVSYENLSPESPQPAIGHGLLLGMGAQLVATPIALRPTLLAWPKVAAYTAISVLGSFFATILVAWFMR